MRSLIKAITSGRPFLVDYSIAETHIEAVKKHGLTDILAQFFGPSPKPYQVGATYVIPIVGMIGRSLSLSSAWALPMLTRLTIGLTKPLPRILRASSLISILTAARPKGSKNLPIDSRTENRNDRLFFWFDEQRGLLDRFG